jgi:hypothetical protein
MGSGARDPGRENSPGSLTGSLRSVAVMAVTLGECAGYVLGADDLHPGLADLDVVLGECRGEGLKFQFSYSPGLSSASLDSTT